MKPLGKKLLIEPVKADQDSVSKTAFVVVEQEQDTQEGKVIAVSKEIKTIKAGDKVVYYTGKYPKRGDYDIVDEDSVVGII